MQATNIRSLALIVLCLTLTACSTNSKELRKIDDPTGLEKGDNPAEIYVQMAEQYYSRGQIEVAFKRAQLAVKADDSYARAHSTLGFMFEKLGKAEQAQKEFEKSVRLEPDNSEVRRAYANYLCRQHQYTQADAAFTKALANPLYARPWAAMMNAGDCAMQAGDVHKAEGYYRAATTANPRFGPPLSQLAKIAYDRGDMQSSKKYIESYFKPQTIRTASASVTALSLGAKVEAKLGNRKGSETYQRILKEHFPNAPQS